MLNRPHIRIDMRLTDEHIFNAIKDLLHDGSGRIPYEVVAQKCECHPETVRRSVSRLQKAGRLKFEGGSGRLPVKYAGLTDG